MFLQGLLKLIRTEEHAEQHAKAYMCLGNLLKFCNVIIRCNIIMLYIPKQLTFTGRLAMKCPSCFNNQFALLEELVKKIPDAVPEIKTALRDALLEMATAYKITPEGTLLFFYILKFKSIKRLYY